MSLMMLYLNWLCTAVDFDHFLVYYESNNHSNLRLTNDRAMIVDDLEESMIVNVHDLDEVMHLMVDVDDLALAMWSVRIGWMLLNRMDLCMVTVTALDLVMVDLIQYPSLVHSY